MSNKTNGYVRAVCAVVGTILLLIGVAGAWYDHKLKIQEVKINTVRQSEDLTKLEIDGCDPAQRHETSIAVIETKLDNIENNTIAIIKAINER